MATNTVFLPKTTNRFINATVASAQTVFTDANKDGDCLRIAILTPAGAGVLFVKAGKGDQTATAADLPFPAAAAGIYVIGVDAAADTVAVILDLGTALVAVTKGEGV